MKNIISNSKMIYHMKLDDCKKFPITADIYLTDFCNNNCKYCGYRRFEQPSNKTHYITFEDFKTYVNKLQTFGVKGFILTGGGEPTLNKDFDKITEYLEENNINYGINTNFNIYKAIKPKFLKISLDGWSKSTYQNIRGVDAFDRVIGNILKYDAYRKHKEINVEMTIQMVATKLSDVKKFYKFNKELPVDHISIRPVESIAGQYYQDIHNYNEATRIVDYLTKLKEKDDRIIINYKYKLLKYRPKECFAKWTDLTINTNGDVLYCCNKPYEIVCNLKEEPNVIQAKLDFKTDMCKCDMPCRLSGPNYFLEDYEKNKNDPMNVFI